MIELFRHQKEAVEDLRSGSVLCGEVGTGKTLTSLEFYRKYYGDRPLIVITTPKKRDENDWVVEAGLLGIEELVVDSWNNIQKYDNDVNAFFIFDEQRAVGYGSWGRSFIKIALKNKWIMCSATPGDVWMDYMPLFIANGFYKNKTDFVDKHVEYDRFSKFPKVKKYHDIDKLMKLRRRIIVTMRMERHTTRHHHTIETSYDEELLRHITQKRWNPYTQKPIKNASELTQCARRVVAESDGRIHECAWQLHHLDKLIIFYNWDYELDILKDLCEFVGKKYSQYNGHKHEDILDTDEWVYLVQYRSGSDSWNCTLTNNVLFYSPNYSYRVMEQCEGRIDRLNTPFNDLHYTLLLSNSSIDKAVMRAVSNKRKFNETIWGERHW